MNGFEIPSYEEMKGSLSKYLIDEHKSLCDIKENMFLQFFEYETTLYKMTKRFHIPYGFYRVYSIKNKNLKQAVENASEQEQEIFYNFFDNKIINARDSKYHSVAINYYYNNKSDFTAKYCMFNDIKELFYYNIFKHDIDGKTNKEPEIRAAYVFNNRKNKRAIKFAKTDKEWIVRSAYYYANKKDKDALLDKNQNVRRTYYSNNPTCDNIFKETFGNGIDKYIVREAVLNRKFNRYDFIGVESSNPFARNLSSLKYLLATGKDFGNLTKVNVQKRAALIVKILDI